MWTTYCDRCGAPAVEGSEFCEKCTQVIASPNSASEAEPNHGLAIAGVGCLMPFLFAGLSLLSMFMAVDGRGGSGLIAVFGFAGGLVVGIPMVIIGLVISAK